MKKLILYDHTGKKQAEHDVFVDGSDFVWTAEEPVAMWFGKILLVDKEPAILAYPAEEDIIELTEKGLEEVEATEPEVPFTTPTSITETDIDVEEEIEARDRKFREEYPEEPEREEEKVEPETIDDKGTRDSRIDEANALEDTKETPEVRKHRKSTKAGKGHRQSKST